MSASTFLLHEAASGYALFQVENFDEIGGSVDAVQQAVTDVARFGKYMKLIAFKPFTSAANALEQINAVSESQVKNECMHILHRAAFGAAVPIGQHRIICEASACSITGNELLFSLTAIINSEFLSGFFFFFTLHHHFEGGEHSPLHYYRFYLSNTTVFTLFLPGHRRFEDFFDNQSPQSQERRQSQVQTRRIRSQTRVSHPRRDLSPL